MSQSKSKGLRTKNVDVQRQEKKDVPPYTKSSFFYIFVLLELSVDWMMPNCNREGNLTLSTDSNGNLFRNTLTDTPRNNILPAIWLSLRGVKLTHTMNPARRLWSVCRGRSAGPGPVERYVWSVSRASGETRAETTDKIYEN